MKKALLAASLLFWAASLRWKQRPRKPWESTERQHRLSREGMKIAAVRRSFVLGSVRPSSAAVTVNGSTVSVYRTGAFCVMIPFEPGDFKITASALLNGATAEAVRSVTVAEAPESLSTATWPSCRTASFRRRI